MRKRDRYLLAEVLGLLAILFLLAVRTVDVAPIGPEGTSVGFARLNGAVASAIGLNMTWYRITQLLGYLAILVAGVFALVGLGQCLRRRSLRKVDRRILALAGLYAAVVALYALFEVVVINYRPVVMPGDLHPEPSFPSTHTMITCVVMGSAAMVLGHTVRNAGLRRVLQAACAAVLVATVVGRLLSGVHWLSDILGGLLISAALLAFYAAVASPSPKKR